MAQKTSVTLTFIYVPEFQNGKLLRRTIFDLNIPPSSPYYHKQNTSFQEELAGQIFWNNPK